MPLSHYGELFRVEAREHIGTVNHLLLTLEAEPSAREPVEGLFRAVHTIKGMSATMGYRAVADLSHEMESVLDLLRSSRTVADTALVDLLFEAADALEKGIEDAVWEREDSTDSSRLLSLLRAAGGAVSTDAVPDPSFTVAERGLAGAGERAGEPHVSASGQGLLVRVIISAAAPLPGVRAFMVLQRARELGEVDELSPGEGALLEDSFDGSMSLLLRTDHSVAEVRERLYAVGDLEHLDVASLQATPLAGIGDPPGTIDAVQPQPAELQLSGLDRHMRVDRERLDALMDRVGELVILRDRLRRVAAARGGDDLLEPVEQVAQLIGELSADVLQIRMVPVGQVFDRFPRLVRDASRTLGKKVDLEVEGRGIELDRALLDHLGDPLVHLLRNAIDHGIEAPAERLSAGKPERGRIRLTAARERTRVLIRVEDDGRGINRERVIRKAVAEGLVTEDAAAALSDGEVFLLLMRSGFSTASSVTDVSGRGVGLDVVAQRVRALGGTLDIVSELGRGTTFTLRLPLTVGIVRAVLVALDGQTYAVPVAHVAETVELRPEEVQLAAGRRVGIIRDEPVPLARLRDILEIRGRSAPRDRVPALVLEIGEQWLGIEVDAVLGQQEVVLKPFDATSCTLPVFSGATVLPDGRPALILDAASLLRHERSRSDSLEQLSASSPSAARS